MFIKKGWSLSINKKYRRLKKWNQDTPTFNTYLDDTHKEHIISDHTLNVILKKRGIIIEKFLKCFNTKIGIFFLGCSLKIFKNYFNNVIGYDEEKIPIPSIKHIIQNFEKIA